jgi:histidyl-tRNA synthetase
LKKQEISVPELNNSEILVAYQGKEANDEAVKLASELRCKGIAVILSSGERSLKAQLRHANNLGCNHVAILGEEELKNNTVSLRNMITGEQQSIATENISGLLGIAYGDTEDKN